MWANLPTMYWAVGCKLGKGASKLQTSRFLTHLLNWASEKNNWYMHQLQRQTAGSLCHSDLKCSKLCWCWMCVHWLYVVKLTEPARCIIPDCRCSISNILGLNYGWSLTLLNFHVALCVFWHCGWCSLEQAHWCTSPRFLPLITSQTLSWRSDFPENTVPTIFEKPKWLFSNS